MDTTYTEKQIKALNAIGLEQNPSAEYALGLATRRDELREECLRFKEVMRSDTGRRFVDELFHTQSHHELRGEENNPDNPPHWFRKQGFSDHVAYFAMDSHSPHGFLIYDKGVHKPRQVYRDLIGKLRDINSCHYDQILKLKNEGKIEIFDRRNRFNTLLSVRVWRGKTVGWSDTFQYPLVQLKRAEDLSPKTLISMEQAIMNFAIGIPYHPDHSPMWN